jgi:hypothetical protein
MEAATMQRFQDSEEGMLTAVGLCLMIVQAAERALQFSLNTIFEDEVAAQRAMLELVEGQKPTLGYFLKELRTRVKLERTFKDKLYRFLKLRNIFIHNVKEVPGGWNLKTVEGRQVAFEFLVELILLAAALQSLFLTAATIASREEIGVDIAEGNQLVAMAERLLGPTARRLLLAPRMKSAQRR